MVQKKETQQKEGKKMFGTLLFQLFPLGIKLGFSYLRFKKKVQKAESIFKEELETQDIDQDIIQKLVEQYLESSHVIKSMGINGFKNRS